jgi:inositol oxygenase
MSVTQHYFSVKETRPLNSLDEWENGILESHPDPADIFHEKTAQAFRYDEIPARGTVRDFYRLNHQYQTYDFVMQKRADFLPFNRKEMPVWEAFSSLNELVNDSDPGTGPDRFQHSLQTAEAIRAHGHPDWMVLVGLVHDMGKVLCLFGEPQWAVVGDTFPVGCAYSNRIVFSGFFNLNPDYKNPAYNTKFGIYEPGCGLRNVHMSWGHAEYVYQMMKDYLPEPALYMLRYQSFYAWHRDAAYDYLLDDHDMEMFGWVKLFIPYDLYSKSSTPPDWKKVRPYYEDLVAKYLPASLKF